MQLLCAALCTVPLAPPTPPPPSTLRRRQLNEHFSASGAPERGMALGESGVASGASVCVCLYVRARETRAVDCVCGSERDSQRPCLHSSSATARKTDASLLNRPPAKTFIIFRGNVTRKARCSDRIGTSTKG